MLRRIFLVAVLSVGLTAICAAQEKKSSDPGRLSGFIRMVDRNTKSITMVMRRDPNVQRVIVWDASTTFTYQGKSSTADELKEGLSIVAVGKFDEKTAKLAATQIALTLRQ